MACAVEDVSLGRDVVHVVDELCFWYAWYDWTAIFEFAVVGKDGVDDEVYLALVDAKLSEEVVDIVG